MALKYLPAPVSQQIQEADAKAKKKSVRHLTRVRALAAALKGESDLTEPQIKKLEQLLDETKSAQREAFLKLMRDNEQIDDVQLIARIRHRMATEVTKVPGKIGKPKGMTKELGREKMLLAYRLSLRGLTNAQIGEQMDIHEDGAKEYIIKAKEILRIDPTKIDVPQQIGETINFYEDVRAMALFIASAAKASNKDKVMAMHVALACERDRADFLTKVGVYTGPVAAHLQALVIQQLNISMGHDKKDPTEQFFAGVSGALLQIARQKAGEVMELEVESGN